MKKAVCIAAGVLLLGALAAFVIRGDGTEGDWKRTISRTLGTDVSQGRIVDIYDDHTPRGGHGDGYACVQMQFPEGTEILAPERQDLPLPFALEAAVWGAERKTDGTVERWGPLKSEEAPQVPSVEHGWYWFYDSNAQGDPRDPSMLWERESFNYVLALYDTDTARLYYMALDT